MGRTASRSVTVILAALLAAGALTPVAAAVPLAAPPADTATSAATEAEAVRLAKQTGKAVPIQDKNTETTEVLANPKGSFTLRSNARPVRVKKNGAWRGIDTTLKSHPDGTVAPVATAVDMAFSGGGHVPIARVAEGDGSLAVTWPDELPKPVLTGNTATYPDVLPGVDLKMIAEADTYVQTLVVRDARAARNPALAALKQTVTATNLALRIEDDGRVSAMDKTGTAVFIGSAPRMWDSSHDPKAGPAPTAVSAGGAKVTEIPATAKSLARSKVRQGGHSSVEMVLTPDAGALTGPGVRYPLFIDPHFARNREQWTEVTTNAGWTPKWRTPDPVRVGRCYDRKSQCGGTWTARSYFSVGFWDLKPRQNGARPILFSGSFIVGQLHSSHNCDNPEPTDLYGAGNFDSGTRWPGPAGRFLDRQWSNAQVDCGGGRAVKYNAASFVQEGIDHGYTALNFGLLAPDEGNDLQWKVFDNNPVLEVEFSYPPNKAYDLRVSNAVNCNGKVVTPDAHPMLYAKATDNNDPPLNPALWYHVTTADESRPLGSGGGVRIASGTEGGWREPDDLGNGDYKFRVYVDNNPGHPHNTNAGYSDWYHFTTRSTPLTVAPTIETSVDYPKNYWGAPTGAPGNISVRSNGAPNIVGYTYTFNGAGTETLPGTTDCVYNRVFGTNGGWIPHNDNAPNWIPLPASLSPGYHTLHVSSFDDAHKLSPESEPYTFYVAPQAGQGATRIEAENMPQSQPAGQNRPVHTQHNAEIGWSNGQALWFVGNASGQSLSLSFDTSDDADFNMSLGMTRSTDIGRMIFELDGRRLGDPTQEFDGYHPIRQTARHNVGVHRIPKGSHTLTIKVVGTNPSSVGDRYTIGVDYLTLSETSRSEAEDPAQVTMSQPPTQNVPTVNIPRDADNPAYTPSRGGAVGFMATEPGQSIDFTFRTRIEADYALGVGLAKGPEGGQFRIAVNKKPLMRTDETPWDSYDGGRGFSIHQPLGGAHLGAGVHRLTITIAGKNVASRGYKALVDYITAIPINKVTAADFTAAMNNDGIGADGTRADLDLMSSSLSTQNLAAAGYGPGAAVTVNGATFTMPAARADGADNVIAIGQTIPFPAAQQVKSTAVGLLAASTCGDTRAATATIRYTDETTQDSRVPALTDWLLQETKNAAVVLPYWNLGGTPWHNHAPRLTALFVPTDPTKTVKSITLPNYGTSMLPGSCSPALHVLAIAPRPVAAGWIGAWAAPADAAKPTPGGVGFADQTLRTVLKPKVTGGSVRVRVANPHANIPVTIAAASLGAQTGTGPGLVRAPVALAFGGKATITLPAGGEVLSDPVAYPAGGTGNLTVSLHLPNAVKYSPAHHAANNLSEPTLLANGNATTDTTGTPFTILLDGPRYLAGVLVSTSDNAHGTVAVLGDQLTAAAPLGANEATWVDHLPGELADGGMPLPGGLVNAAQEGVLPAGLWRLDDGSGTTARDTTGSNPLTLNGGATWSPERGGSVAFDGTGTATAPRPPFVTDYSYAVSVWVKVTNGAAEQTVIDAEGNRNFGFNVRYTGGATPRWAFHLPTEDTLGGPFVSAMSTVRAELNVWTHLVVSYNAPGKYASLWVNGVHQSSVALAWAVGATKRFVIGRDLRGLVSDVRAYQTAASNFDVTTTLYGVPGASLGFGAPTAYQAYQSLDRTVQVQPNLRTVIVSLGANDVLAGMETTTIKQSLTRLMHTSSPTSPRHTRRPDGNLVRVVVTTIPALGLPADDPREQRRQEINADLMANYTNYGANDVVDIAAAVADPGSPHQVRPGYLTGGKRNPEYHRAVAQTIADAVTAFPPRVLL
ncbi:LamG-like jellyroll fold domain-containing protein [Nonomuraea basaltis]|uniref:LamG-like jellyroll fold domain-containing protein n=1 Tax=Nonomuraea basaltis TaxID=2495887 RepID=UPI00110C4BAB|nr:LamG-like jellyroll fold domain-containing protein [Nonomuraea basaltis]TMR96585.1 SGNH hydrolase [Nonomuraea basaltis]